MSLSCSCHEYDGEGWAYLQPQQLTTLEASKRKRCCSCKKLIDKGADCLKFERFRAPNHEVEINIYGEDGEIYLNLTAAGYCLNIEEDMHDNLKEYWAMTGFNPEKYKNAA